MVGLSEGPEGTVYWDFAAVRDRLVEAVEMLDRHVPSGRSPFAGDGPWAQVIRDNRAGAQSGGEAADYIESETFEQVRRRSALRTAEVERMNEALGWVEMVRPRGEMRKTIYTACMFIAREGTRVSWVEVKRRMRSKHSPDTLRKTFERAIASIARQLSR